jgi:ABC-type lipoprotein export system ATPase subunit
MKYRTMPPKRCREITLSFYGGTWQNWTRTGILQIFASDKIYLHMLEFQNIGKIYSLGEGQVTALDGISFSLSPGEFLVVKGPSGCGKTTLLLVAGCLLRPSEGKVTVNGQDPYEMSIKQVNELRARIFGFVFQQFHLIPYLSVTENILSPALALKNRSGEGRVLELVRHFGLEDRADHLPHQLSTGEKQRTAMARAILNKPSIILADEPTGNLDEENSVNIYNYLKQYTSDRGAVLLVSHDSMAMQFGTRILEMDKGRLNRQ